MKKREFGESVMADEVVVTSSGPSTTEEAPQEPQVESAYERVLASAEEIRKNEDVLGYILRGEAKATVDLVEPAKIVDYAILSSQLFESAGIMAESLGLGGIQNTLSVGKDAKVLCMVLGENLLSIFVKKAAPHDWLLKIFAPFEQA